VPKADERASTGAAAPARSVHDLGPGLVGPASLARAPTSRAFGAAAPSGSCWVSEIWSVEAVFVLYLFAGRFKNVPPLHGFPIDLTLLFLAATCGLLLWGRQARALPAGDRDQLLRQLPAGEREVQTRAAVALIVWFSVILVYYMHYRWSAGGDPLSDPSTPSKRLNGDNYLEYADHAYMLFGLALGVFGSPKQSWIAALGSGMALSALLTIGGRGSTGPRARRPAEGLRRSAP
jgi:hypothetical protein